MEFTLRKWRHEDAGDAARFANNEKIARNLRDGFPHPYTEADAEKYIRSCIANESLNLCYAIDVDGTAVGSVGVYACDDVYRKSMELGYWLGEEYWGKGIMSEAARRICAEAFAKYDIVRIYAEPYAYNQGSRKVLEKSGFTLEGIMRQGVFKNGKIFDYCMYALLRDEA